MSYTHAQVLWSSCIEVNSSIVDKYGDLTYATGYRLCSNDGFKLSDSNTNPIYTADTEPISIYVRARKQPHEEVIIDKNGHTIITKSIFYVEPQNEPYAFEIKQMDTLDGEKILKVYEMRDLYNRVKLIRFITA